MKLQLNYFRVKFFVRKEVLPRAVKYAKNIRKSGSLCNTAARFAEFLSGSRVSFEVEASDEDPAARGTRRRYSSCGSPLVPPVATGER